MKELLTAASLIGTIFVVAKTVESMRNDAQRARDEAELLKMVREIHARVVEGRSG